MRKKLSKGISIKTTQEKWLIFTCLGDGSSNKKVKPICNKTKRESSNKRILEVEY